MLDGVAGEILAMKGDTLLGLDTKYTNPPDVAWPLTFGNIAASVLLPLKYPDYTAEVNGPRPQEYSSLLISLAMMRWPRPCEHVHVMSSVL